MSARYAALPTQSARDADRELDAAFDSDDDEDTPLNPQSQSHPQSPRHPQPVPGAYDFEREYDCPPPGSPPPPSALALPNNIGNSNGMLPTDTVAPSAPRSSFFRRAVGALLPTHYTRVPGSDPRAGVHGGGIENDGVFANVMAKPQPARTAVTADGEIYMVPEDNQKEPPPVRIGFLNFAAHRILTTVRSPTHLPKPKSLCRHTGRRRCTPLQAWTPART
jgi:hypothetical protein